jgi:hypothetical protein
MHSTCNSCETFQSLWALTVSGFVGIAAVLVFDCAVSTADPFLAGWVLAWVCLFVIILYSAT